MTPTLKVGDRVTRVGAKLLGTVTEVRDVDLPGGVTQKVTVRWDNGFTGRVDNRQVDIVEKAKEG